MAESHSMHLENLKVVHSKPVGATRIHTGLAAITHHPPAFRAFIDPSMALAKSTPASFKLYSTTSLLVNITSVFHPLSPRPALAVSMHHIFMDRHHPSATTFAMRPARCLCPSCSALKLVLKPSQNPLARLIPPSRSPHRKLNHFYALFHYESSPLPKMVMKPKCLPMSPPANHRRLEASNRPS